MRSFSVDDQLKVINWTQCVDDNGERFEFECFSCASGVTMLGAKEFGDRRFQ